MEIDAEAAFLAGRWPEAHAGLAALSAPTDAQRFKLAWCALKLGRPEEALERLAGLGGPLPQAELLRGRALLAGGRAAEARRALEGCALPAAGLELGFAHYVLGEPAAARRSWERWLRAGAADWGVKDALARFLALLDGGPLPGGAIERPEEPLEAMAAWAGLFARYGLIRELERLAGAGPRLGDRLWARFRPKLEASLAGTPADGLGLPAACERCEPEPPGA